MTDGMTLWKVSYHGGGMFALVEAATPEVAISTAKAHRKAKRVWRGDPPASLDADAYTVNTPTERDIRWCHECGVGVQTGVPARSRRKGTPARVEGLRAIRLSQDMERADGAFRRVA